VVEISHETSLLLKGICHPDDVRRAIDAASTVSIARLTVADKPTAVSVVLTCYPGLWKRLCVPVLFDSGVRTGTDIIKAIALGATAVGIGRPYAGAGS